jgi:hypothetical protein
MNDDAANLLAFLRNGFPQAPPQPQLSSTQLLNLIAQYQQQQQLNNLLQSSPLGSIAQNLLLLQQQQRQAMGVQASPQKQTDQHIAAETKKTSKQGMTALKITLDHHQMQQQPLSSSTSHSIDEGVMTSSTSPTETVSGTVSPMHDDVYEHEMPKEAEHAAIKRPAAIQDMLLKKKKKARLDGLMNGLFQKKVAFFFGCLTLITPL